MNVLFVIYRNWKVLYLTIQFSENWFCAMDFQNFNKIDTKLYSEKFVLKIIFEKIITVFERNQCSILSSWM